MRPRITSLHVRPPELIYWCVERIQGQVCGRRSLTIPHDNVFKDGYVFVYDPANVGHKHYVTDAEHAAQPIDPERYDFWHEHNGTYYWFKGTRSRDAFTEFVRNVPALTRSDVPPQVIGHRVQDTPSALVQSAEASGDVEARYMAVYLQRENGEQRTRLSLANLPRDWNWETHWVFYARELTYPRNWYSIDSASDDAVEGYTCYVNMGQDRMHFRRGNVAGRFANRFHLLDRTIHPGPEFRPNR